MYNTIDYQNALWGKDLYTEKGLLVRAEILKDYFPEIQKKTDILLNAIKNYNEVPMETLINMNQRVFSRWLGKVYGIIYKATELAKEYLSHEKDDIPIMKLGDRDINRVALISAYKNQTDIDIYDTVDNIIFVVTDLLLGFNPLESCLGIIAAYTITSEKKYNKYSISEMIKKIRDINAEFIMSYKEDENGEIDKDYADNVYLNLLSKLQSTF